MRSNAVPSSEKEPHSRKVVVVLLIEDDDSIGELLVDALSQERHHYVFLVRSCTQALAFVQHIKPDLCLVDYGFPDGHGLRFHDQLHARDELEAVPVIFMTAAHGLFNSAVEQQHFVVIEKPFDIDTLLRTVEHELLSPVSAIQ